MAFGGMPCGMQCLDLSKAHAHVSTHLISTAQIQTHYQARFARPNAENGAALKSQATPNASKSCPWTVAFASMADAQQ